MAVDALLGIHSRVIPAGRRIVAGTVAPLHTLRIVYRAHITGGHLRNETDGSTNRAGWFTLDRLVALQRVKLVDIAVEMAGLAPAG